MAGIPGWALGLGAAKLAPDIANDWMGVFNNVNAIRDNSNANDELQRIQQFKTSADAAGYRPADGYLSPTTRQTLEKLRQDKLDALFKQEASPIVAESARLNRIAATDPTVGSPEGLQDFASRPDFWTGAPATGVVPGGKVKAPVASAGTNPYIAQAVQQFGQGNQNILDAFRAGGDPAQPDNRMSAARIATNKDLAVPFKDVAIGQKDLATMNEAARETAANDAMNRIIAGYPLDHTVESWNGLADKLRSIPGLKPSVIDAALTDIQSRNKAPVKQIEMRVGNGPNSTVKKVWVDMFGEPVAQANVQSVNNPSDRELGLIGSGEDGTLDVSWVGPDGTPNAARIARNDLPGLKASLQAQGVKTLDTVDGKRASKREVLIKPETRKRGLQAPAGAAPAAPTGGGFTYVNGKLVKN